jgi:Sensory domain in DIguanylate Cyclases and Two-component system
LNRKGNKMLAVTECEKRASREFGSHVKKYIAPFRDGKRAVSLRQTASRRPARLDKPVDLPHQDLHHVFDTDMLLALSRAIEDLAEDTGCGELISTFQHFNNFTPYKKRYRALAKRLDSVRVWGAGQKPDDCPGIDFIHVDHTEVKRYWVVLFDSPERRAVLLSKQINTTENLKNKTFVGFYSFNPFLVQSVRYRFNLLCCGLEGVLSHWEQNFSLPKVRASDVDTYFKKRRG